MSMQPAPNEEPEGEDVVDAELVEESAAGTVEVHKGAAAPEKALVGENSWSDVETGDLAPEQRTSMLTLIPMNGKVDGGFVDPDTGETDRLEYDFIWLAKSKTRSAFIRVNGNGEVEKLPFDAKNTAGPGCRSFNGTKADMNSPLLQNGGDCTTCPLSQWHGDEPPLCRESVVAMAFIPDEIGGEVRGGRLVSFSFHGLSLAPAKAYWRSFDDRLPVIPPIAFLTHVSLEPKDTDNGTFLAARFARVKELSRTQVQPLIDARSKRLAEWQSVIEEDVRTQTASSGESAGPFDDKNAEARTYGEGEEEF